MAKAKSKGQAIQQDIAEFEEFLDHFIPNNKHLQSKGLTPIALNLEGPSGIGKTSFVLQYAQKHNLQCIKLNLAQMEELGDLVGFPAKEHEIRKGEEVKWVPESTLSSYIKQGYDHTGEKRMTHAKPDWISGRGEGGILILDDYSRADK